jgi:hypothetical protein
MEDEILVKIIEAIKRGDKRISSHAKKELKNDNLEYDLVWGSLESGQIIEIYPDTGRGPSYLILSWLSPDDPVHTVIGYPAWGLVSIAVMITVYRPNYSPDEWNESYTTRKDKGDDKHE